MISIFSVTLVVMYGQTRILFAMGRDGLLPSMFAKVNPRSMTPVNNTIIVAVVVSDPGRLRPAGLAAGLVSIGTLVAFIMVSIGVIILRVREPDLPRGLQGAAVIPSRRSSRCSPAATCSTACRRYTWLAFGVWVAVVLVFYFVWGRHHSALNDGGDGYHPDRRARGRRCADHHPPKDAP